MKKVIKSNTSLDEPLEKRELEIAFSSSRTNFIPTRQMATME
jgi:hypothetical protein